MRIALLSYRSKAHVGGQGVYVRHLTRELAALGHTVEVLSGQPYPELDPGVRLTTVPSLDLYREPRPFSRRVMKVLAERAGDFDVVHDNQTLGSALLDVESLGVPLVATIHHPITMDRRIELAAAPTRRKK